MTLTAFIDIITLKTELVSLIYTLYTLQEEEIKFQIFSSILVEVGYLQYGVEISELQQDHREMHRFQIYATTDEKKINKIKHKHFIIQ